jgi:thioredoxin-like negative regulator of GroEL
MERHLTREKAVAMVAGGAEAQDTVNLADVCRGASGTTEANYYRIMHLLAAGFWLQGRATQALSVLTGLLNDDRNHEQESLRRLPCA